MQPWMGSTAVFTHLGMLTEAVLATALQAASTHDLEQYASEYARLSKIARSNSDRLWSSHTSQPSRTRLLLEALGNVLDLMLQHSRQAGRCGTDSVVQCAISLTTLLMSQLQPMKQSVARLMLDLHTTPLDPAVASTHALLGWAVRTCVYRAMRSHAFACVGVSLGDRLAGNPVIMLTHKSKCLLP